MNAVEWLEEHWRLPERDPATRKRKRLRLRPWQKAVLRAMFPEDGSPSQYETFLISTVKKGGKTTLNAAATLYGTLSFPAPETTYVVANDERQAKGRVFELIVSAVREMGMERRGEAQIARNEIVFDTGSKIVAVPCDPAGEAGGMFGISSWTELWAFRDEQHVRMFEELTPVPNRRSLRIVDSYAGFVEDAPVLEPLWTRAVKGERPDPELPILTDGGLWAFIDQGPEAQERAWLGEPAEMEAYYREQARSERPGTFARHHLNKWQAGEEAFVSADQWDACVDPELCPVRNRDDRISIMAGVDAASRRDCAAVVAVTRTEGDRYRLVDHRIWAPRGKDIDLEDTIEAFVFDLKARFRLSHVVFDPHQMRRSEQTFRKRGISVREFRPGSENKDATQNLYDLIREGRIELYPDKELRKHALNAAVKATPNDGQKLDKQRAAAKIDGCVALSYAAFGALNLRVGIGRPRKMRLGNTGGGGDPDLASVRRARQRRQRESAA
jgi:phage terminase large subunit-like protein